MAIILPPGVDLDKPEQPKQEDGIPIRPDEPETPPEPVLLEPTDEEKAAAQKVAEFLFATLTSEGAEVAFFATPNVMALCTKWLEATIGSIISNVCLADRQKILQKLDASIKEQMRVQAMLTGASQLDPKISAQLKATVRLDPRTCQAIVTALINIMGSMPPPGLKLNLERSAEQSQGQSNPEPVSEGSEPQSSPEKKSPILTA